MKTIVTDVAQAFKSVKTEQAHVHRAQFFFQADLPVFKGHFPGHPIVPGVYLLECAAQTFMRGEKLPMRLQLVKQAKFMAPVHPPCEIEVTVTGNRCEALWRVDCSIRQGETIAVTALIEMTEKESLSA